MDLRKLQIFFHTKEFERNVPEPLVTGPYTFNVRH